RTRAVAPVDSTLTAARAGIRTSASCFQLCSTAARRLYEMRPCWTFASARSRECWTERRMAMKLNQPPKDRGADQNGLLRFVSAPRRALSIAGSPRGLAMRAALIAACLVAAVPTTAVAGGDQFDAEAAPQAAPVNYQGLWWAAPAGSQSGWGLNLAHQGDVIF